MTPSPSQIFAARADAGGRFTEDMLKAWGVSWPPSYYTESGKRRYHFVDELADRWRKENLPRARAVDIVAYASTRIQWAHSKGSEDYWALCPFHGERSPSFHVTRNAETKNGVHGAFKCFGCGEKGDVVDLCMALEGLSLTRAMEKLLGGDGAAPVFAKPKPADPTADERKRRAGRDIWRAASPLANTLGEEYLRRRGIGCDLAHADLRFMAHAPEDYAGKKPRDFPAMVAAIRSPLGEVIGAHLTYLTSAAQKRPSAPPDFPDRRMIGNVRGGFVRLGELGPRIVVGEGIESALSASEISGRPAIASLNKGNMAALPAIDGVTDWLIAYDRDAVAEGRALARNLLPIGVKIQGFAPPEGCADWNDVSQRRRM